MSETSDLKSYIAAEFNSVRREIQDFKTDMRTDLAIFDKILNGNGQPGLVKTVAQHNVWIKLWSVVVTGILVGGSVGAKFAGLF